LINTKETIVPQQNGRKHKLTAFFLLLKFGLLFTLFFRLKSLLDKAVYFGHFLILLIIPAFYMIFLVYANSIVYVLSQLFPINSNTFQMLGRHAISTRKPIQLLHAFAKHRPQLLAAFASNRRLHLSTYQSKWLTAEEAKRVADIPVGSRGGHPEDPEKNTSDTPYYGSPDKGDIIPKGK
jgi:hypothetical protein